MNLVALFFQLFSSFSHTILPSCKFISPHRFIGSWLTVTLWTNERTCISASMCFRRVFYVQYTLQFKYFVNFIHKINAIKSNKHLIRLLTTTWISTHTQCDDCFCVRLLFFLFSLMNNKMIQWTLAYYSVWLQMITTNCSKGPHFYHYCYMHFILQNLHAEKKTLEFFCRVNFIWILFENRINEKGKQTNSRIHFFDKLIRQMSEVSCLQKKNALHNFISLCGHCLACGQPLSNWH